MARFGVPHPTTQLSTLLSERPVGIVGPIFGRTGPCGNLFIGDRDVAASPGDHAQQNREHGDPEHSSPQCEAYLGKSHIPVSLRLGTTACIVSVTPGPWLFAADARTLRLPPHTSLPFTFKSMPFPSFGV